jgi:formylglycine-generating enzyme required for sulfatase activity
MTNLLVFLFLAMGDPEWVRIPAGEFQMGCEPASECPEQTAPRMVRFEKPWELMKTEVTVAQFRRFVEAAGYRTHAETSGFPWSWQNPRSYRLDDKLPVTYVNLQDAEAYCKWTGARVPNEAEWTYAFRAGGETLQGRLWWNPDGRYVWSRTNSGSRPHPVASRLPNRWGLHDMEGNVWEWTLGEPGSSKSKAYLRGGSWATCQFIEGKPKPGGPERGRFTRCPSDGIVHFRDDIGFRCAR